MIVLALTFGVPGFVWAGAGLATAPLILHLLYRQRYRQVDWAAMKWLLEALRKNYRRVRLEQWLLLAVRMLIIFLVATAMAQPALDAAQSLLFTDQAVTHNIIVFDNSSSMQYTSANQSCWERAKAMAHSVLGDARTGDVASVVVMGMPASVLVGDASPYLDAVSAEIEGIRPQHAAASVDPALDLVRDILKSSHAARRRIWFLTDLQRSTWLGESAGDAAETGRKLRSLSDQARCTILDPSSPESPNLCCLQLEQVEPVVVHGRPTVLRATVGNYSNENLADVPVELVVDGQVEATERVTIPAREQRTLQLPINFSGAGYRSAEVRLPDDALRLDDRRWLEVSVRQSLSVLIIDGQPTGEPFRSESDYLRVALSPGADDATVSLIRSEVRSESDLLDVQPDEWDLIALCNVAQLTEAEAGLLRGYVERGGGVVFFLGSQTNIEAFNRIVYRDGKGMLAARLIETRGDPGGQEQPYTFDPGSYVHPVIEPFKNAEQAGLLTTKITHYIKAAPDKDSTVQVALAYQSGDPAILVSRDGRGFVGLVTTSADLDWNTWAISPSFVPIVQELTRHLVAGRVRTVSTLAAEPVALPIPRASAGATVVVTPPGADAKPAPVRLIEKGGAATLAFTDTDISGTYQVDLGPPDNELRFLAVNPWPAESDLSKLSAADIAETFPGWEVSIFDHYESAPANSFVGAEATGELHRPLLYFALVLLFVETCLAWKFAHHA